jgi:calcineurin-like phosphoesterase family protein
MMTEQLREMYLNDLRKEVCYDGKNWRPRVRNVKLYERIPATVPDFSTRYENVWIWSDTHFGHKNIIGYCDRPFCDVDEMTQSLIDNHNEVVGDDDLVIWVGDVAFMSDTKANEILDNLKGERVLIVGNHDINKGNVRNLNFKEKHLLYCVDSPVPTVFTHFPFETCPPGWINVHGHIHNAYGMNSVQHINVSVEVIGYKPIHWEEISRMAKTRWESMEHEIEEIRSE